MRNRYSVTVTNNNQHIDTLDFGSIGYVARYLIANEQDMLGQQVTINQTIVNGVVSSLPILIDRFTVGDTK